MEQSLVFEFLQFLINKSQNFYNFSVFCSNESSKQICFFVLLFLHFYDAYFIFCAILGKTVFEIIIFILFFYLLITFLLILLVAKAGVLWYIYHSITKLGWLIRVHIIQLISMIFQGYGGVGTSFICSSNTTNLFQRCAYWHVLYMCLI